jgi:glycerol-3-phosphate acyltransferase PlsY
MQVVELFLVSFLVWQISAMPIPVWIATAFFGVDAEDYNSKSGWAENKFSFENNRWSILVFCLELLKGLAAISVLKVVANSQVIVFGGIPFEYMLAVIVVLGHSFPIYNEFKRTNSLGAYFGVFTGLWLIPGVIATLIFLLFWAIRKNVGISSLLMSLGSFVMITFIFIDIKALVIASVLSSLLIVSILPQNLKVVRA